MKMQNFLISLTALRDSTKYALDFLNSQNFAIENTDNNSVKSDNLDCVEAFDVLKTLKRDVRTFTNTNFLSLEEGKNENDSYEDFKDCETNLDNLHSQLSLIVDSFNNDNKTIDTGNNESKEPKLNIVLSHQEVLKSVEVVNSQNHINSSDKENNSNEKNTKATEISHEPIVKEKEKEKEIEAGEKEKKVEKEEKGKENENENENGEKEETGKGKGKIESNPENENKKNEKEVKENMKTVARNKNDLHIIIDDASTKCEISDKNKSSVAKNFLLSNTMPQTPEIEKIKNYVTDVDLNKLNNIEIIKLILDSLIQTCNELLQFKSDILSDVLGTYPKSPLSETAVLNNSYFPKSPTNNDLNNYNSNGKSNGVIENNKMNVDENKKEINENESIIESLKGSQYNDEVEIFCSAIDNSYKPGSINDNSEKYVPTPTTPTVVDNSSKQKNPKELLKELECLIILIHSLYENGPNSNVNSPISPRDFSVESYKPSVDITGCSTHNDSMSSILTSNTELNSVINAIDSLLKASPRFNNQCVQITADSKKKFQLMGVMSVVDRMTRTRLNDQRASPKQLDHINRLIELLNKSLVRQYGEQRFTISPDKEKKMELGRLQYLLEKSKNSRLSNQDWCSQKVIREKEIEDIFEQSRYKSLENQRFIVRPEKERDMYFNSLLNRVDKLDSFRFSNQDAVIKKPKPVNDSLYSITSNESETETQTQTQTKRRNSPIKRLRRFSKSIKS